MAKAPTKVGSSSGSKKNENKEKRTSIGLSKNTKPNSKNDRRNKGKCVYRGQGR